VKKHTLANPSEISNGVQHSLVLVGKHKKRRHLKSNDIFHCRHIFRPSQTAYGVGKSAFQIIYNTCNSLSKELILKPIEAELVSSRNKYIKPSQTSHSSRLCIIPWPYS
jgi:hypothetical protein